MRSFFSKPLTRALRRLAGGDTTCILMLGLSDSGKTTLLYSLKWGEILTTIPNIGMNVETVENHNVRFTCWDVGPCFSIRRLWDSYFEHANGLIFVVDSNNHERIEEASEELHQHILTREQMRGVPLLVYANKQDLPKAMSAEQLAKELDLSSLKDREWFVQTSCITSGDGVYEGLEWLSDAMKRQKYRASSQALISERTLTSETSSSKSEKK